jgi:outer membrane protein OmpA-like peptidoglycan-associated protein
MKTIRFLLASLALLLVCGTAQAQFGKRLGKAIENAAKNATVRKAEQKTEEAVSKGIDKATDPDTYKDKDGKKSSSQKQSGNDAESGSDESAAARQDTPEGVKVAEMTYAKSDFVPGDEIIFDDPMDGEQLGEFPSMWDLVSGVAEVATVNGKKAIVFPESWTEITPLMKDMNSYLPDQYTIEMDLWITKAADEDEKKQHYNLSFKQGGDDILGLNVDAYDAYTPVTMNWSYKSTSGQSVSGSGAPAFTTDGWHHLSISFNKRACKMYLDGVRFANIPNMAQAARLTLTRGWELHSSAVTNVRIAKGAVPLYDRMMTDGKFITYGITFDVGKSTIKPESMGEINRIVKLMQDNPTLKFSVEGHTDSTGNATSNQKLSDERSAAVVAKLVEMGVAKDRLQSAGKGQTSPIADNGTDEGRAKNRRVEFIKIN